ncbi:MAG TPA: hypothetical protein VGK23_08065 [Methanomassiliicoccales archaeon]|jgi:hypothetical protein
MVDTSNIVVLLVAFLVSTIIIYAVTRMMGERESIGRAMLAAVVGWLVYAFAFWWLGNGLIPAIVGGIFWLLALKALYKIGWVKATVIALLIWVLQSIIGLFLPTLTGPIL